MPDQLERLESLNAVLGEPTALMRLRCRFCPASFPYWDGRAPSPLDDRGVLQSGGERYYPAEVAEAMAHRHVASSHPRASILSGTAYRVRRQRGAR